MAQKQIIFDFDGTIADSMWVIISIYEELLHHKVTPELVEHIRGLSAIQAIKELKVPLWQSAKLMTKGKRIMSERLHDVTVFEGMPELLQQLNDEGHELRIMSSNSEENVRTFLREHGLSDYFIEVQGGVGLFGKAPVLRKIMRQNGLKKAECYYVGDEARDIDGAKKAHVPIISVGWGYNNAELLRSLSPDYFVEKPADILKVIA